MIKAFLICDSSGYSFYSKKIDESFEIIQPELLSGLISAIGMIGKKLFKEEIATITYGDNNRFGITIISKELFGNERTLYFVFMVDGEPDKQKMRQLCVNIFIEAKQFLKNPNGLTSMVEQKIDRLIESKYDLKDF